MRIIYVIGTYLVFVLLLPLLLLHPKLRAGWGRRLGLYPRPFPGRDGAPRIWFHGASAGDLSALSPMIKLVRERRPDAVLTVSCLTNSGAIMGKKRLSFADEITFQPWDLTGATRRAVEAIRPDILVLEYTEIWPNLIAAARSFGARIVLTNGRFSKSNVPRYKLLFALSGQPLASLDLLLMRTQEEAERALALGAAPKRVLVTGNTKFDALVMGDGSDPSSLREAFGLGEGDRVLVAGSTHEGEEAIVLEAYRRLLDRHPDLRLVIAPRYLERVERIAGMIARAGFEPVLRSAGERPDSSGGSAGVGLLDTIGELPTCYRLASLVFVGGSFTNRGGQNILEPAARGSAVIFGPNMKNFTDSVQILAGRGGIQVGDPEQFVKVLSELLGRPSRLRELGRLARRTVTSIRGASERNVELMLGLIDAGSAQEKPAVVHADPSVHSPGEEAS